MFFILSKTISLLFLPGTLILLCWVACFLFRKRRWSKYLAIVGVVLFVVFTNDFFANALLKAWEPEPVPYSHINKQHYTYGVVLTGMTNTKKQPEDRSYFGNNTDRLLQALTLFHSGVIDTLFISGGGATAVRSDLQESRRLKTYLSTINFPMDRLVIEDQSRNTVESARMAHDIIKSDEALLLITSASHMPRAKGCFEKEGFTVEPFPTTYMTSDGVVEVDMFLPSSDAFKKWHILFKEWMGYASYKVMGYI